MELLTDEQFSRQFRLAATDLERIKLAVKANRYTTWTRSDKSNFPEEYMAPILLLPDKHEVKRSKRKSGGEGYDYVVKLKYEYRGMGKLIPIYLKGFFSKEGSLVLQLEVQSLREDQ